MNRTIDIETKTEKENFEDTSLIQRVNKILEDAVLSLASDIHLEPFENQYRIRFRQDGILYQHSTIPLSLGNRMCVRIKILSQLDISLKRIPQDGRFTFNIVGHSMDHTVDHPIRHSVHHPINFRVSTCPTLYGEKIVIRILDPLNTELNLDNLGLESFQKTLLLNKIQKPQGLLLVTGPTGSGKTITLYSVLHKLNAHSRNISTCEDPVEIHLPGINQVNIHPKIGLTFATTLRALLRQDPDVIMVGEIRDFETAEVAIKAAQTGHMVLSTLHTNSAAESLTRLMNMGIPAYHLASSISLVIAQRLIRKLCEHCKVAIPLPMHAQALLEAGFTENDIPSIETLFAAKGCTQCKNGYKGRMAIYEMMPISPTLSQLMLSSHSKDVLYQQAIQEGMWDLRYSGLHKVKLGLTSLEEINRVI